VIELFACTVELVVMLCTGMNFTSIIAIKKRNESGAFNRSSRWSYLTDCC